MPWASGRRRKQKGLDEIEALGAKELCGQQDKQRQPSAPSGLAMRFKKWRADKWGMVALYVEAGARCQEKRRSVVLWRRRDGRVEPAFVGLLRTGGCAVGRRLKLVSRIVNGRRACALEEIALYKAVALTRRNTNGQ